MVSNPFAKVDHPRFSDHEPSSSPAHSYLVAGIAAGILLFWLVVLMLALRILAQL